MRAKLAGLMLGTLVLCGALGAPALADEVTFRSIEREHFHAIAVATERGAPSTQPLVLKLAPLGDAADADLAEAWAWLRQHAGIEVVLDPEGAPLFLTRHDLSATSGRATLGATVPQGIAVEVRDLRVARCVAAHEVLHLLGLRHVEDPMNIMYPHCIPRALPGATLDAGQRAQLDAIETLRATHAFEVRVWAQR